jgi:hypothetical protein
MIDRGNPVLQSPPVFFTLTQHQGSLSFLLQDLINLGCGITPCQFGKTLKMKAEGAFYDGVLW